MHIFEKIKNKSVVVGIVGMGYVGLPLGLAFANSSCRNRRRPSAATYEAEKVWCTPSARSMAIFH